MTQNRFNGDNTGVSPVIGVILMVAITVILAAVIGTLVMGIGQDSVSQQASASVSAAGNDDVTLTSLGSNADGIRCSGYDGATDEDTDDDAFTRSVGTSIDCTGEDSDSVVAFSDDEGVEDAAVYTFD